MRVALVAVLACVTAALLSPPPLSENLFGTVFCTQDMQCSYGSAPSAAFVPAASIAVNNNGEPVTGWDVVVVRANASVSQPLAYFAMGYAEGYATSQRIYQTFVNQQIAEQRANMSAYVTAWITDHVAYMRATTQANSATDAYWAEVGLILQQVDGLADGFNDASAIYNIRLDWLDLFLISFNFEIGDVVLAMERLHGDSSKMSKLQRDKYRTFSSHCSALIKPVAGGDVLVTHTTWSSLESMLRQHKIYQVGDYTIAFSSYAGTLHSGDDFYVTSTGFAVLETTNENYNNATAPFVVADSVSEFIRVMVSNKVAMNGSDWGSTFCRNNSGTYNNQWMILNLKLIEQTASATGEAPGFAVNGSLQVVEQMPGLCISEDQTTFARRQLYWSSFNRPFYDQMYHWAGTYDAWQRDGNYFSYDENYRRLIFARNESLVTDLESIQALIRYNDYLHDPLSIVPYKGNCSGCVQRNAELSISARADLTPPNESWGSLFFDIGEQDLAGIDGKVVSLRSLLEGDMNTWIVNGPTSGGLSNIPVFRWNESLYESAPHFGIPQTVNFPWVSVNRDVLPTITQAFAPYATSNVTQQVVYDVPLGRFEPAVFGALVTSLIAQQVAPGNLTQATRRAQPPKYCRGECSGALFYSSRDSSSSVVVDRAVAASPQSTVVTFWFEGANAVQYTNIFSHTLVEDLSQYGMSPAASPAPAKDQDSGRNNTTVIAVGCCVGAVVLLSIVFAVLRSRRNDRSSEDAAMNDVAYAKLA